MKTTYSIVVIFFLYLGFLDMNVWADTRKAVISSVQFSVGSDHNEIVSFKLDKKVDPSVLNLGGQRPRAVFDFVDTEYEREGEYQISAAGKLVKSVRIGRHNTPEKKTRIVLDLATSEGITVHQRYDFESQVFELRVSLDQKTNELEIERDDLRKNDAKARKKPDKNSISSFRQTEASKDGHNRNPKGDSAVNTVNIADKESTEKGKSVSNKKEIVVPGESLFTGISDSTDENRENEFPTIIKISFERSTNDKEMILFKLSGFHPPVVFATEEENLRVVCDFPHGDLGKGVKNEFVTEGKYINRVRAGEHVDPDKVRVVLDLSPKFNYDLKQVFFKEENLFVLVISSLGKK